jgi:hypothetical protein
MDASLTVVITSFMILGSLALGTTIGWMANDAFGIYLQAQAPQVQMHPEMYDDDGTVIREELYSVRFIPDEGFYDDDYDED